MTHGDLKPSNLMLDPRTGIVKIIDLGASRRFVHLSNAERDNRRAVEELDRETLAHGRPLPRLPPQLCEGLGSLTGSPYYMAPEILLQATRYVDVTGRARSVLEDYEYDYPSFLAREQWPMYQIGLSDLRRGWGIRADIWSWACTVQALLLKTVEEEQRPSSSTISPYDFSFSRHRDEMIDPLYEKAAGEEDVPRFHQWCRVLPLLIVRIALEPVPLIPQADGCSQALRSALKASLRHQDLRPSAGEIQDSLEAARPAPARLADMRPPSIAYPGSRPTSREQFHRQSQCGGASQASFSPPMNGSDIERSTYATPPLSQGASSVSTPQQTCETVGKSILESTPERDNGQSIKKPMDTSSSETSFYPGRSAEDDEPPVVDNRISDPVPQGFELVSPTRIPKIRSSTVSNVTRPATAGATLQGFASSNNLRPSHSEILVPGQVPRSHPSTPVNTGREGVYARPMTSPRPDGLDRNGGFPGRDGHRQSSVPGSSPGYVKSGHQQRASTMEASAPRGLGISSPVEGMRSLQLHGSAFGRKSAGGTSIPSSPMAHLRGASVPPVVSNSDRSMIQSPTTFGSGGDIGGSPRGPTGEGRMSRQGGLMATLKDKQVRLKQSSRKLMGRKGTGRESAADHTDDYRFYGGQDDELGRGQMHPSQTWSATGSHSRHDARMASPETRHGGASIRRSNRGEEGGSPTKPLLKRLLTWGNNSSQA